MLLWRFRATDNYKAYYHFVGTLLNSLLLSTRNVVFMTLTNIIVNYNSATKLEQR